MAIYIHFLIGMSQIPPTANQEQLEGACQSNKYICIYKIILNFLLHLSLFNQLVVATGDTRVSFICSKTAAVKSIINKQRSTAELIYTSDSIFPQNGINFSYIKLIKIIIFSYFHRFIHYQMIVKNSKRV